MAKLERADTVLWLDAVPFTKGGFINRNRMGDGSWLTVPIKHAPTGTQIRYILIDDGRDWRRKLAATIRQHYGHEAHYDDVFAKTIQTSADDRLATFNMRLMVALLRALGVKVNSTMQSHHALISQDATGRLVEACRKLHADTYLSGPSGADYLDSEQFDDAGIDLKIMDEWTGPNPTSLETVFAGHRRIAA